MSSYNVLSEFERGACANAIEFIARCGKPVVEVGSRVLSEVQPVEHLESDLRGCIAESGEEVSAYVLENEPRAWAYGFFAKPWVLAALRFLYQEQGVNDAYHRHWIAGLLFGYEADAIGAFLARFAEPVATLPRHDSARTVEIARLPKGRCDNRSSSLTAKSPTPGSSDPFVVSFAAPTQKQGM